MKDIPTPRLIEIDKLKPHPQNYQTHPEDQLAHIMKSMDEHGFYRNVVAAKDLTILAGHGITEAAHKRGYKKVPVIVLDIERDSVQALKLLAGDNQIGKLAEVDDRALSNMLKSINDLEVGGLLGTGFDEMMLANLVMVTRNASEIGSINESAEWVGMPNYEPVVVPFKIVFSFRTNEDRDTFVDRYGFPSGKEKGMTWATWWPERERDDMSALKYQQVENAED